MGKAQTQLGIRDLAERLSLSVGTISRAINDRPGVRPDVRRRVLQAVERTGYVTNRSAQMLRRKRTRCIQWQIPTLRDLTYVEFMGEIDNAAARHGYEIEVTSYQRDRDRQTTHCRNAIARRMEAVIIMGGIGGAPIHHLVEAGIVVLAVNAQPPVPEGVATLEVDHVEGMRRLAHHLIQLGHRRFMVSDRFNKDPRRRGGLITAMREARLPEDILVFETDARAPSEEDTYNRVLRIFRNDPHAATAIMSANDQLARGVTAALAEAGLSVPGDVSVTGMGNLATGRMQRPALTTLSVTDLRMGEIAMEMLGSILDGDAPRDMRRTLTAEMIVRQSTGPAKDDRRDGGPQTQLLTGGSIFTGGLS